MAIPGNMLSPTTEMVDPNTSGWVAALNCTISLGSGGRNGDGTLRLTSAAAGEMRARTVSSYRIVGGEVYFAFCDASSATEPERIGIRWLNAAQQELDITWSLTTASASASWHRISVAGAAPADAVWAQVLVSATVSGSSVTHDFENAYLGLPIRFTGNLFGFNTESTEIDASAWMAEANGAVGRQAPMVPWPPTFYLAGGHVATLTASANGNTSMAAVERPVAVPGQEYIAYLYINPPTNSADCWIELRWYDADGAQIGSGTRAYLDQTGTGWYRQIVSDVAPAGAATCGIAAGIDSATAGQVLRVEGVVMAVANDLVAGTVVPYSDASFEQGVGSWSVVSGAATIARSAWQSTAPDGTYWAVITSATATASVVRSGLYPVGDAGGLDWRWQVRTNVSAGSWDLAMTVRWYDDSDTEIGATSTTSDPLPTPGWWIISSDDEAPAGATQAALELDLVATATSSTLFVDRIALWQALPFSDVEAVPDLGMIRVTLRELPVGRLMSLWRVGPDGQRTLVRGPSGLYDRTPITSDLLVIEDYEAPLGVPISYWFEEYVASTGALGGTRNTDTVTLDPGDANEAWLTDPANPQRNMRLVVQRGPDWQRPTRRAEYTVRGRRNPVPVTDVRGGLVGDLAVWTRSDDERAALHLLLDSGNVLLWRTGPGFGVGLLYVSVGDVTEGRITSYGREPWRTWTLPLTEADMPVATGVNGSAGRTWRDPLTEFTDWQTLLTPYATWESLLLDQRRG